VSGAGFDRQEFVFSVEVTGRTCSLMECSEPVAATLGMVTLIAPGKVAYDVSWSCAEHAAELEHTSRKRMDDALITSWTQEILPKCLLDGCEEDATHIAFVARDYGHTARRLEAMSLCGEHAAQLERDLNADR
jgi:hypothetical protein